MIKHDACTHPRTPAGRAACRKANGNTPQVAVAGSTARTRRTPAPRAAKPSTARTAGMTGTAVVNFARTHGLCPDEFVVAMAEGVRLGYDLELTVVAEPNEYKVIIRHAGVGEVTLLWDDRPYGTGQMWRPAHTSITRRIAHVNHGLELLAG